MARLLLIKQNKMDNFKTLFEKKEYELVIKVTQNSSDVEDLFYCLSAFLALNKIDEALSFIDQKFNILKTRLPLLMKIHIELLCLKKDFDTAYEKVEYYKNLPYYSQEAEEILKELPKIIREYEKTAYPKGRMDENAIKKALLSKDTVTVLGAIDAIRDLDIIPYLLYLKKILVEFPNQSVRSFTLLFLVNKKINDNMKFLHIDKFITVNPSKLHPPFIDDEYMDVKNSMVTKFKDVSIAENAFEILSTYLIYIYPEEVDLKDPALYEALKIVTMKMMKVEYDSSLDDKYHTYIEDIEKSLKDL